MMDASSKGSASKSKRMTHSMKGSEIPRWKKHRGLKRLFFRVVHMRKRLYVFLLKQMTPSTNTKWRRMQLAYRWEMDAHLSMKGHGHGHGDSSQTFDFLGGVTAWGLVRLLVFVFFLGIVIGTTATGFFYLEHVLHDHYLKLGDKWSKNAEGYTYIHWLMGATISGGLVGFISKMYAPECVGAGVDATKICMAVSAPIPAVVSVLRIIVTSVYVAFGNPLGIEAPTLHVSASLASSLLHGAAKVLPEDFRLEHLPTWVLVGMTTGMAAGFGAPLVGMMYAIEEYMNIRKIGLSVVLIGVASTVGVFFSAQIRRELDAKLNVSNIKDNVMRVEFNTGYGSMLSFLVAFLCALLSQITSKLTLRLRLFNSTQLANYIKPQYHGLIGGFVVGCIGMAVYRVSGSKGVWGVGVQSYSDLLNLPMCTEEAAGLRRLTIASTPGIFYLQHQSRLLDEPQIFIDPMDGQQCIPFSKLVALVVGKLLAVCVAVSVGGPGGLFFPALVIGGTFGGVLGGLFQMLDPSHAMDYHMAIMLGMVGFYSALLRTPMTAILVAYEMSGYGALGLSIGLTYSMIITSVLAHLLAEAMDSTDLVSHMMLQDGIDVKELFKSGLSRFADVEEEGQDDHKEEDKDGKQHRWQQSPNGPSRGGTTVLSRRAKTSIGETAGEGCSGTLASMRSKRNSIAAGTMCRRTSAERQDALIVEVDTRPPTARGSINDLVKNVGSLGANIMSRRGRASISVEVNKQNIQLSTKIGEKTTGQRNTLVDMIQMNEQGGAWQPESSPIEELANQDHPKTDQKTKEDRIAQLETVIKQKKKGNEADEGDNPLPQKTSLAHTILLTAAKRALAQQRTADNKCLHILAKRSNVQGMHEHLMGGARVDMNWVNPVTGGTCLIQAIDSGLGNGVRLLLYKRCDPNFVAKKGDMLPILKACKKGVSEAVMSLIAYGADLTVKEEGTGNGCLHLAAASGNENLLRALIRCNASLSETNNIGSTAMIVAARSQHHSMISILTSESWRIQKGGEECDFLAKYVLKRSRQTVGRKAENGNNSKRGQISSNESTSSSSSPQRAATFGSVDIVAQFREYDPQEGGTAWDDAYNKITATTLEDFEIELKSANVDVTQLREMGLNLLWQLHINLKALFYAAKGTLIRHVSMTEVRLLVDHHGHTYVLMEHNKDGACRFINMIAAVPDHHIWLESATSSICQNFLVSPLWMQENVKELGHELYVEKIIRSKFPQFHTTYHINCATFKIINPKAPACTEHNFLGLPAAEPFLRNGKVWRWELLEKADHLFDWGVI
eukprot:GEMP01002309.1.p1 GENE.GEMP01002309.1~~GEMP01002309.1.p1  ORF type:complete len:1290 (+),score=190.06 GEMP01002309.1:70-3939(+)